MCLSPVTSCHNFSSLISVMVGLRGPSCNLSDKPLLKVSKMSRNLALQEQQFGPENFRVTFLISFVVLVLFCFWHSENSLSKMRLGISHNTTCHHGSQTYDNKTALIKRLSAVYEVSIHYAGKSLHADWRPSFLAFHLDKKILDRLASKNVTQLTQKPVFDVYAFGTCFFFKVYICQYV